MNVDVVYQGLALVKQANARTEGGGLFVELEAPMPVGTPLELVTPEGTRAGRVESVVEGVGAGMLVGFGARKSAEPNAPMAEMKSAPQVQLSEKEADSDGDDEPVDEKPGEEGNKKKKKRPRKTVIGH